MLQVVALAVASAAASAQGPVQLSIDPRRSTAQFSVSHIWVDRVSGSVPILRGTIALISGSAMPSSITATLDATRISTSDPDRDAALESPDFFDAKQFPTWTFSSTKIVAQGASAFVMFGDLTLHGVLRPVRLDVTVAGDAAHPVYHARGQIDRRSFGMAVTRLDPVIGNPVDVTLDVYTKP